jgi:thiamine-monophosphate kinase
MAAGPDEFRLIADLFAPLSKGFPGAHGLTDDAAYIPGFGGRDLAVTTDAVVEGVHFKPGTPPGRVAQKALRVNLSDLAAKGAQPFAALMTVALPKDIANDWLTAFTAALKADLDTYGLALIGGDTVSTPGPLMISITVFGWVEAGRAPLRSGARVGDTIWVSGTIGDAALGLHADDWDKVGAADRDALRTRYELPLPRVELGAQAARLAHAAMDVSDGLIQDLGHIAKASGVGADVQAERIPLSPAARAVVRAHGLPLIDAISGGDDYEILMTAPPEADARMADLGRALAIEFTPIGRIVKGSGVRVLDPSGHEIIVSRGGWRHFSSE